MLIRCLKITNLWHIQIHGRIAFETIDVGFKITKHGPAIYSHWKLRTPSLSPLSWCLSPPKTRIAWLFTEHITTIYNRPGNKNWNCSLFITRQIALVLCRIAAIRAKHQQLISFRFFLVPRSLITQIMIHMRITDASPLLIHLCTSRKTTESVQSEEHLPML